MTTYNLSPTLAGLALEKKSQKIPQRDQFLCIQCSKICAPLETAVFTILPPKRALAALSQRDAHHDGRGSGVAGRPHRDDRSMDSSGTGRAHQGYCNQVGRTRTAVDGMTTARVAASGATASPSTSGHIRSDRVPQRKRRLAVAAGAAAAQAITEGRLQMGRSQH